MIVFEVFARMTEYSEDDTSSWNVPGSNAFIEMIIPSAPSSVANAGAASSVSGSFSTAIENPIGEPLRESIPLVSYSAYNYYIYNLCYHTCSSYTSK